MEQYLIRNARVVKPMRVLQGDVCLRDGVINYIGEPLEDTDGYTVTDGSGLYALPGFIDIHCHGGAGFDFTAGEYDTQTNTFDPAPANYPEALARIMHAKAMEGTTRTLLTTIAAPLERLETVLSEAASYIESDRNGTDGAELFGTFIEGTFIRLPDYAGAQNPDHFTAPTAEVLDRLNAAAQGTIRYVNVVPEYGEAALQLTDRLTRQGVMVGAGHTSCPAELYRRAVAHGLRVAIHFTNGPTGHSFKPFGGGSVLQCVLTSPKVYAELIGDGYHVNPPYLMDILHRKGNDRIIAITDAMFVTGAQDITTFEVGGVKGRVSDDGQYLMVEGKENMLFGSMLTMRAAFANWVSWLTRPMPGIWVNEHPALGLDDAVLTASRLCSVNPARALRIFDPVSRYLGQRLEDFTGGLQVGKRADLVLMKISGETGSYEADVKGVFVGGERIV